MPEGIVRNKSLPPLSFCLSLSFSANPTKKIDYFTCLPQLACSFLKTTKKKGTEELRKSKRKESYEMGSTTLTTPFKDQTHYSLAKKLLPWTIYAFFPIVIFRLYFYPLQLPQSSRDRFSNTTPIIITSSSTLSLAPPPRLSPSPHFSPYKGTCILYSCF